MVTAGWRLEFTFLCWPRFNHSVSKVLLGVVAPGWCCTAVAVDDTYLLTAGADTMVLPANGILLNDTVPCDSAVTIQVTTPPTKGTLVSAPAPWSPKASRRGMAGGGFTYRPNNLQAPEEDSFEYTITCNGMVSLFPTDFGPLLH